MIARLNAWWSGQSARERSLLSIAAVLCAALLLWFAAVSPALTARQRAERGYDSALALYAEMTAGAREAARLRLSAPSAPVSQPDEPLRAAAGALARDLGLPLSRIQPGDGGALVFVFDTADPADLFRWLEALQTQYGAAAAAATVTRNAGAQTVQASVTVVEAQ